MFSQIIYLEPCKSRKFTQFYLYFQVIGQVFFCRVCLATCLLAFLFFLFFLQSCHLFPQGLAEVREKKNKSLEFFIKNFLGLLMVC